MNKWLHPWKGTSNLPALNGEGAGCSERHAMNAKKRQVRREPFAVLCENTLRAFREKTFHRSLTVSLNQAKNAKH